MTIENWKPTNCTNCGHPSHCGQPLWLENTGYPQDGNNFYKACSFCNCPNVIKEIQMIKKFITSRLEERTTWDGAMIIGLGLIVLIAGPRSKALVYIAIAYGAWTIYKSE